MTTPAGPADLPTAAQLAELVLERDRAERGYAQALVRLLAPKVETLRRQRADCQDVDVKSLIG